MFSRCVAVFSAIFFVGFFCAAGEEPFSLATTPGKLPKTVIPHHYAIHIEPDLRNFTTMGWVSVEIEVQKPVNEITLNALDLKISDASLAGSSGKRFALKPLLVPDKQLLVLKSSKEIAPGNYRLSLDFRGKIIEQAEGFFYAKYRASQGTKLMLATEMEPADARRMFPCWDEPAFRATFDLTIIVPENFKAFSNMPAERETPLAHERKEVSFARTPPMSSYLVVLVAGELETLEDEAEGVKLRVVTTEGKSQQGRYALDATKKLLAYYNNYFGIKYPLPKLDQFAIPGGFDGGMENWGGIAYNESVLLYDPARSSPQTKRDIFVTVAHEMSHQWFGDLVTMGWWDNLWLNEGFATWMETKATDHFNPEWQMWLAADADKSAVMNADAQRPTHPIQQAVRNESEANDAFDSITYQKGGAFLRMLESYLGEEQFRKGVHHYLSAHQYSNTTTADLWKALEESSGKKIHTLAAGWTEQPGVPLVKVEPVRVDGTEIVSLKQERLLARTNLHSKESWQIPLTFVQPDGTNAIRSMLLEDKTNSIIFNECAALAKVNAGDAGYYRAWYAPEFFAKLCSHIHQFPLPDRFNLLDDCWAMVQCDRSKVSSYLDLADSMKDETAFAIWDQILNTLYALDELERGRPEQVSFHIYVCSLLQPEFARLGWTPKSGESSQDALLRGKIVRALGHFGDGAIIAEAKERFEKYLNDPASLPPDLRPAVTKIAGAHADQRVHDALLGLARRSSDTEERQLYCSALCAALDPALSRETLELSLKNDFSPEEATGLVLEIAGNGYNEGLAWAFTRSHLYELLSKVEPMSRDSFVSAIFSSFSDDARADELLKFAKRNLSAEAMAKAEETATEIRVKAALKQRILPGLDKSVASKILKEPK